LELIVLTDLNELLVARYVHCSVALLVAYCIL